MSSALTAPADWRGNERATAWLANGIAGGAGVLLTLGFIAFGVDLYPDHGHGSGWGGFALCVVAVVVGLVLVDRMPTLLESTGVAMVALGVAAAMAFVQFPRVHDVTDLRLFFAVTIVAWLVAFAVGPAKARPLLLGLALLLALTWATVEVSNVRSSNDFFFGPSTSIGIGNDNGFTVGPDGSVTPEGSLPNGDFGFEAPHRHTPDYGTLGGVSLGFGLVYLLGVAILDSRGRRGVATAAVIPGVIAMIDSVIFFSTKADNVVVAGLLSVAAGLFVGAVGAQSHRRFTVWTGAFGATVGAVILATKITDSATNSGDNSHAGSVFGVFLLVFGAAMVVVAVLAARVLGEPSTGDEPAPELVVPDAPPPAPPLA